MTLKVYTSVLDNEIDEAGDKLLKFIGGIGNKTQYFPVDFQGTAKATT
jgi:hypothetical protein